MAAKGAEKKEDAIRKTPKVEGWDWHKTWVSITTDENDNVVPPDSETRLWWHIGVKGAQAGRT